MSEPARLGDYFVAVGIAIIPWDGAVDDGRLGVPFLLMIPYFDVLTGLEGEGPGIVPLEGLVTELSMPGPQPVDLPPCQGLWWCWQWSSYRPAPQPHGW